MPTISALSLLVALAALSAVLSALEATISSLRDHHLSLAEGDTEKPEVRRAVSQLFERPQAHLMAVLMANTMVNFAMAAIGIYLLLDWPEPWGIGRVPAALAIFGAVLLVADILPKSIALAHPRDTLRRTANPLLFIQAVVSPVADRLETFTDWLVGRLVPADVRKRALVTGDEVETWIEMRRDLGTLDPRESEIIHDIVRLGTKTAKDCMTPRVDAFSIANDVHPDEARHLVQHQSHWRVPIYKDKQDSIVGVLDVKRYLLAGDRPDFREFIAAPVFVPETMPAVDLFKDHLQKPKSVVIVLDEYGGFEGLVTHSDIVDDIVADAAPTPELDREIQDLGHGRFLVSGAARLDEIHDAMGIDLEQDGLDTIGGLVFTTVARIPEPGVRVELGPVLATVRQCSGRRIEEVLLEPSAAPHAAGAKASTKGGDR